MDEIDLINSIMEIENTVLRSKKWPISYTNGLYTMDYIIFCI